MIKNILIAILALSIVACASKPTKSEKKTNFSDADAAKVLNQLFVDRPKNVDEKKLAKYPLGSKYNPIRVGGPGASHYTQVPPVNLST